LHRHAELLKSQKVRKLKADSTRLSTNQTTRNRPKVRFNPKKRVFLTDHLFSFWQKGSIWTNSELIELGGVVGDGAIAPMS